MSETPKMDWREMGAGRPIDRLIAERLGWQFERRPNGFFAMVKPNGVIGPAYARQKDSEHDLPLYSTDLNAAFTLLSTELGLEWNLFSEDDDRITCELGHWFDERYPIEQREQATEKTAALAICKAWLKWMERMDH